MPLDAAKFHRKSTRHVIQKVKHLFGPNLNHDMLEFDHLHAWTPSNDESIHSILEKRSIHRLTGSRIFPQICQRRQGSKPCNKIIDKIIHFSMLCRCLNNHISVLLIPDRPFRSRCIQNGDSKARTRSSQIYPLKGPYSLMEG